MAAIDKRIVELRQRAQHFRQCAQHADNRAAYNEDMAAARRLDDEAEELVQQLHAEPPPY